MRTVRGQTSPRPDVRTNDRADGRGRLILRAVDVTGMEREDTAEGRRGSGSKGVADLAGGVDASLRSDLADRVFWSGHANPASVWSLVLAFPTLILAIYRRNVPLAVGALLFVAANPLLFAPPESDDAWATRVVLGERLWLEDGIWPSSDAVFAAAATPVHLFTIRSAIRRRPLGTAAGTAVSLALMLVFFRRMARRYERRAPQETPP